MKKMIEMNSRYADWPEGTIIHVRQLFTATTPITNEYAVITRAECDSSYATVQILTGSRCIKQVLGIGDHATRLREDEIPDEVLTAYTAYKLAN